MKAINTKYLGPTDHRGSRIKAYDLDGNSVTVPWDYDMGRDVDIHKFAVLALVEKMGWPKGAWHFGATKEGYAWVCVPE